MLKPTEIKYIEEQIKQRISSISNQHFQLIMREGEPSAVEEDYPGWTEEWLKMRLKELYYFIQTYFEARQMHRLLETFISTYSIIIDDENILLKTTQTNPEGEPELKIIVGFEQFLEVFKAFDYKQQQDEELKKLTSILKNTGFILKNSRAVIKGEPDISKAVKWVLGLYYPSCRLTNKASFIGQFKHYVPDILIPELKTAIEYKYVKTKKDNIDDFLDQIKKEAVNYIGDPNYENFIAVIYIENISIATPESIEVAWKSKNFPKNWELVIAGNSITGKI